MSRRLVNFMNSYLSEDDPSSRLLKEVRSVNGSTVPDMLPIEVRDSPEWEMVDDPPPQRLKKRFKFDRFFKLQAFINEVLIYQEESGHHGKISISGLVVDIEVYTHNVNLVTELDFEYSKAVNEILDDVEYFDEDSDLEQ